MPYAESKLKQLVPDWAAAGHAKSKLQQAYAEGGLKWANAESWLKRDNAESGLR